MRIHWVPTKSQITILKSRDSKEWSLVNTKMNEECINKNSDPIYLKASITEQILLACIDQSSFSEIHLKIQRIIPTSELVLREYLFYLVNNSFISYN